METFPSSTSHPARSVVNRGQIFGELAANAIVKWLEQEQNVDNLMRTWEAALDQQLRSQPYIEKEHATDDDDEFTMAPESTPIASALPPASSKAQSG